MRLKYDLNVRVLYISLSDQAVARTREIDDNTAIDLDEAGNIVGIEVISVDHPWPLSEILAEYKLPAGEEAQISAYFFRPSPGSERIQESPKISIAPPAPVSVAAA